MANLTTDLHHGASASSSMASSSASTSCPQYDIFINHRGPDVKNNFVSHLYRRLIDHGFRVFFDREEMEKGHNISSQIEDAIKVACVHIAIFSPKYAESPWCLDELVRMKESSATILPVFFNVNPSHVRHNMENGVYAEALQVLEQKTTHDSATDENHPRFSLDKIQGWRNALSDVANLSGFELKAFNGDEVKLLDRVVQDVLKKVPKTPLDLDVAKYPSGLDPKLKEFEERVFSQHHETESMEEAKVVGIVGVGGVGKTTLAKAFFNLKRSDYSSSCFLFDVRENARTMSLHYLQHKLLRDLKPEANEKIESRDEGVGILKRSLSSCHVLIVLDDVDHMDQLDAVLPIQKILRPDSLILVTSRDKHVLRTSGVLESSIYTLKGMNTVHSKELFCCYAFHQPDPLPEFADLVDLFVKACDGLPLSLKVFGAQVFGQNERSFWQEILERLNKLPIEIQERLRISYNSLEENVQETFLDIACFFLGEYRDRAIRIWSRSEVQTLEDRSLLEVDSEYKTKMHDHIRDMGRKIAEDRSLPRRLWHSMTNVIDDLSQQSSTGKTAVRGIKMLSSSDDPFYLPNYMLWNRKSESSQISPYKMKHLYRKSGSSQISPSQKLEMKHLFNNYHSDGLRNLQLVATEEDHLEDILSRVQPPHLKWIRWYACSHSSLPDWILMRKELRVLEIQGSSLNIPWQHQSQAVPLQLRELNICAPLSDIPKSIGQLTYLERIVICIEAESITVDRLPDEFCQLRSLKYLAFGGFSRIVSLPNSFGDLTNLQHIDLHGASSLQMLPNSFGDLTNLQLVDLLGASSLQMLPNTFGNLNRLKHLSLEGCVNLTMSSITLRNITTLEYLDLTNCKQLKELPLQVAHQRFLQKLYLKGTNLKELPSDIGDLCNLEGLRLGSDLLEALPLRVGDLKSLKSLELSNLPQLKCLPDSIGRLTQLMSLKLEKCGIEYLPQELLKINNLEVLRVMYCPLRELPLKRELTKLQELFVSKCSELRELTGVEHLTSLEKLIVLECEKLQDLHVNECSEMQQLTVSKCKKLQDLRVNECSEIYGLAVDGCEKLQSIQGLGQLTKLRYLSVRRCSEIQGLPGFGQLTNLRDLSVDGCSELQGLPGLGQLTKLQDLYVTRCSEISGLPGVEHLTSLKLLSVFRCNKLRRLDFTGCSELPGVEHLTSLQLLIVDECEKLQSIQGLGQLTNLKELCVTRCSEIQELSTRLGQEIQQLPGVEHLTSLETLNVSRLGKLKNIPGLGQLTHLRKLDVSQCYELRELQGLGQLTHLTKLDVSQCYELRELQGVEYLRSLEWLNISGLGKLKNIPGLGQLTHLRKLDVRKCYELRELQGLGQLTHLRQLIVSQCYELGELQGVEYLRSLVILDACECPNLQWSERVLEQLRQQLKGGFIRERSEISEISAIQRERSEISEISAIQRERCGCLQFLKCLF